MALEKPKATINESMIPAEEIPMTCFAYSGKMDRSIPTMPPTNPLTNTNRKN
jgi:hypothetical protein